jgi:hypothetical protein
VPQSDRDRVSRRSFLTAAAGAFAVPFIAPREAATAGVQTLYNGIRLQHPWPPVRPTFSLSPVVPPYLNDRPAVVPIEVGRQFFVDDFLIEETSLTRVFHAADYHSGNPVLAPRTRWEKYDEYAERTQTRSNPAAMPFSDGVFYDPEDRVFKMWYMGGYSQNTCLAMSHDGIEWDRPDLDIVKGTNLVTTGHRDSSTVWLDLLEKERPRRFKMSRWHDHYLELAASGDGIHWTDIGRSGYTGDRSTFFYNPFRGVWVYSLRDEASGGFGRFRRYWEARDFFGDAGWTRGQPVRWVAGDSADPRRPEFNVPPEVYNLDCVAYESVMLGLFTMFRGERTEREKPNDVCIGFSRDGFHWDRGNRSAFLPVSEHVGAWNWANVQSAGGACLVVGDRLHFYVSGRQGVPGTNAPGICSTGLATLRRDGFASMERGSPGRVERVSELTPPGTLVTRPVTFEGQYLFVNANAAGAELRVDVLDREGRVIEPYAAASCTPITGDSTRARVTWSGAADLARLRREPIRFRFHLTGGSLYSFWVSRVASGASQGYVAAGGPGFTGLLDDR